MCKGLVIKSDCSKGHQMVSRELLVADVHLFEHALKGRKGIT